MSQLDMQEWERVRALWRQSPLRYWRAHWDDMARIAAAEVGQIVSGDTEYNGPQRHVYEMMVSAGIRPDLAREIAIKEEAWYASAGRGPSLRTVNQGLSRADVRHYDAELRAIHEDLHYMHDYAAYGVLGKLTGILTTLIGQLAAILPDPERDKLDEA